MWCDKAAAAWRLPTIFAGLVLAGFAKCAAADEIVSAGYAAPVGRYGHYAAGPPHEYAKLEVRTSQGRQLAFDLSAEEVFEDVAPRIVSPAAGATAGVLAIVSHREHGAALALFGVENDRLAMLARSAWIGIPNRWLNPVAVADLDGDGVAEIAAVVTPHIGGTLKVYRRAGRHLVEIAALGGFSNHVYGSPELRLSTVWADENQMRLIVPDATRTMLRVVDFDGRRLREVRRCPLRAAIVGKVTVDRDGTVRAAQQGGTELLNAAACPPAPE